MPKGSKPRRTDGDNKGCWCWAIKMTDNKGEEREEETEIKKCKGY